MGEYFQQEILEQYSANVHIRMDEDKLQNCFDFVSHSKWSHIKNSWKSVPNGRYLSFSFGQLKTILNAQKKAHQIINSTAPNKNWKCDNLELKIMNDKKVGANYMNMKLGRTGETPSAGT